MFICDSTTIINFRNYCGIYYNRQRSLSCPWRHLPRKVLLIIIKKGNFNLGQPLDEAELKAVNEACDLFIEMHDHKWVFQLFWNEIFWDWLCINWLKCEWHWLLQILLNFWVLQQRLCWWVKLWINKFVGYKILIDILNLFIWVKFIEGVILSYECSSIINLSYLIQVSQAGGLTPLSHMPACNLLVLGAQKKNLTGFSSAHVNPHAGFIFYHSLIQVI